MKKVSGWMLSIGCNGMASLKILLLSWRKNWNHLKKDTLLTINMIIMENRLSLIE